MTETSIKLDFVCPNCMAVNRVPSNRLQDDPICAKCKTNLIPSQPVELTDKSFDKYIQRTSNPVVVDFWASWCGPCQTMAPEFSAATDKLVPHVVLAKLNTESNQVANRFNIEGIPCLIAFKNGKEVARQSGMMNTQQIIQWVNSAT